MITGEKGSGKTSLCEWCISEFQSRNYNVAGLISISDYEDHEKTNIRVRNIRSGETHLLAQKIDAFDYSSLTPRWKFDLEGFEWGNQQITNSVPCDLLIIDELGLMEFTHQKGWMNAFPILMGKNFQVALVVIRPQLLSKAKEILGKFQLFKIDDRDPDLNRKRIDRLVSENLESRVSEQKLVRKDTKSHTHI